MTGIFSFGTFQSPYFPVTHVNVPVVRPDDDPEAALIAAREAFDYFPDPHQHSVRITHSPSGVTATVCS